MDRTACAAPGTIGSAEDDGSPPIGGKPSQPVTALTPVAVASSQPANVAATEESRHRAVARHPWATLLARRPLVSFDRQPAPRVTRRGVYLARRQMQHSWGTTPLGHSCIQGTVMRPHPHHDRHAGEAVVVRSQMAHPRWRYIHSPTTSCNAALKRPKPMLLGIQPRHDGDGIWR